MEQHLESGLATSTWLQEVQRRKHTAAEPSIDASNASARRDITDEPKSRVVQPGIRGRMAATEAEGIRLEATDGGAPAEIVASAVGRLETGPRDDDAHQRSGFADAVHFELRRTLWLESPTTMIVGVTRPACSGGRRPRPVRPIARSEPDIRASFVGAIRLPHALLQVRPKIGLEPPKADRQRL